ncbi:MAG TPA: ABC transporter permease [Candidatus Acidoferrales bacterium]|nr:ABC transporter permease [Candidatus Acidoferrales bacterium]
MRNTWLIIKREYLQRVRTRSFLVLTLLLPAIMTVLMALPAKLASMGVKAQHIVIVTSNAQFGGTVRQQLLSTPVSEDDDESSSEQAKAKPQDQYIIDVDSNTTDAERASLREKVSDRAIDGFVWLPDDFLTTHKVDWNSRDLIGSRERSWLSTAINHIALQQQLSKAGMTSAQTDPILTPIKVEPVRIEGGKEAKGSGTGRFLEIFVMVMLLYMAVLFYGISVMRSVLEEKNSRIMEVLLSSATPTELMTGKLLGVGAVGLTQILVWTIMAGVIALPSMAMQPNLSDLQISPIVMIAFAVFFLLGYLLYSTMYAAIGAITTTEQEGQQIQFLIVIPLVLSVFMLMPVIRTPDSAAVMWMSLIPFFAPILMYARIVVQTPPLWQIAVCLVLMVATVAGLTVLCARIYRIGVLIYGKRATLPEIMKWLKYAKT